MESCQPIKRLKDKKKKKKNKKKKKKKEEKEKKEKKGYNFLLGRSWILNPSVNEELQCVS
jgi:hypothetical protein